MEKENLKEECIELFLDGKSYTEIAKLTNHSRNYIANLIRDDNRVKEKLNTRTVKVYKLKNKEQLENKKILLIDDIYTTGSTVNECAKTLQQANIKKIDVFTIAKD